MRRSAGCPHKVTDISGDTQVGLLPCPQALPSPSLGSRASRELCLSPKLPWAPEHGVRQALCKRPHLHGPNLLHGSLPLLWHLPSLTWRLPTSTGHSTKDADHFQGERQDQANRINGLIPLGSQVICTREKIRKTQQAECKDREVGLKCCLTLLNGFNSWTSEMNYFNLES